MRFDRSLDAPYGEAIALSPLVSRLLAANPGPFTFKGTGVHILGAGACVAVVDPGPDDPVHIAALKRAIGKRRVSHILVTHTHRDHSPAAAPLKSWSGATVYGLAPLAQGAGEGVADEAHDHAFVPDVAVSDGAMIGCDGFWMEAVLTPGHAANHVCYGLPQERALFCGDHVMGWSTSVVAPPDGNMGAYLASLQKLAARDDRILYPTHGSPITDPRAWLNDLIGHRRMREAQVAAAVTRGDDTVAALVARLYPGLDAGLQGAAASQVQAHLDHLMEQGAIKAEGVRYRPSS